MSRKLLALLTALLLLLALATYVYYRRTLAAVPVDPYTLVPDDAVLVLSTHDHPALVRHLQETELWDNLTAVRYFQQAAGHLALADSLAGGSARRRNGILALLGRKLVITSVHVTGPGEFDVLYQIPLARVAEYRQVRSLLETLGRDPRYQLSTRDYEDQELTVLTERRSENSLTVLNYRNHLVVSANPGLVESVVRCLAHPDAPTVLAAFSSTDLLKLRGLDASLLVNYRRLPQFLDVLFRKDAHSQFDQLAGLVSEGLLGVKLAGSRAQLQGFSNPETARGALHQRLRGQPAQPQRMTSLMSTRTAMLLHLAADPARTWPSPGRPLVDSLGRNAALDSLRASFDGEMAIGYLATAAAGSRPGRLAFVRCPVPARTNKWLARLRRIYNSSPAFTRVGPYEVHPVAFPEAAILGPLLAPARPYAVEAVAGAGVMVGNFLVLSDDLTLNGYLADVVAGRTWAQSPTQVSFLQETLPQARLSIIIDTRNSWNALLGVLTEERRAGLLRNEALFKRFPQIAMQLVPAENESAPDAQYYTQLLLRHPDLGPALSQAGGAANGRVMTFQYPLLGAPTLLPALGTRIPAVVVQDSTGVLYYVSADNTVLWSDTLTTPVVGLNLLPSAGGVPGGLLLGAGHKLHLLANDGREVLPFPLNLPDSVRVAALLAAPGNGAGTPARLLAVTAGNDLLLLDAKGHLFPGWQPKQLDFPLVGRPALLSVNGRDVVLVPLQNGYVYAFDGKGSLFPGFPLSMGGRLAGGVLVQAGATLARSRFTLVNQHGELVVFNLSGDIISRTRVATWSRTARFRLVPDPRGRTFAVTREDGNQLDVFLPKTATPLITQRFVTSGEKPVQYFDFGNGRRIIAITETGPGHVFVYDGKGRLLGGAPMPSTGTGVGLSYDATTDTYQLVRTVGRELRRTELKVALP
ncbi:hypothetical protein Q3A66_05675 [Hymenobacter sp. BT770]|uniref:hypothetical protein n=1 Tax=Hymenobacter sp. BT770 TaxID=2886942 RepID=UPI001D1238D8|nr:hypothetical protein [Hymenobacter sp. BT770]MCC3152474.1 hypothetical protein [Hymenobacter sp. BT770]MDO3414550.1 hypothetical protein [Hymenobacter sp. BT770]